MSDIKIYRWKEDPSLLFQAQKSLFLASLTLRGGISVLFEERITDLEMFRRRYHRGATEDQLQLCVGDAFRFLNASTTHIPGLNSILSQQIQAYRDAHDDTPSNVFDLLNQVREYLNGSAYQSALRLTEEALNLRYDPNQGVKHFASEAGRIYRDWSTCAFGNKMAPELFYNAFKSLPQPMLQVAIASMNLYDSREEYDRYDFYKVLEEILAATPPDQRSAASFRTRPTVVAHNVPNVQVDSATATASTRSRRQGADNSKFCAFHRVKGHTTEECRAANKKKSKSKVKFEASSNSLHIDVNTVHTGTSKTIRVGLDSHTSHTIVQDPGLIHDFQRFEQPLTLSTLTDSALPNVRAVGEGKLKLTLKFETRDVELTIANALLLECDNPSSMVLLKMNSFTAQPGCPIHVSTYGYPHLALGKDKLKLDVHNNRFFIKSTDVNLIRSDRTKGKPARVNSTSTSLAKLNHSRSTSLSLKHLRLGHISTKRVIAEYNARGVKLDKDLGFCLGCVQGKSSSKPINSTASKNKHRSKQAASPTDSEGSSVEPIVSVNVLAVGDNGQTASQEKVNVRGPGSVVVSDITYLECDAGKQPFALFRDVASGHLYAHALSGKDTLPAALQAYRESGIIIQQRGDIFYSDNESVYRSAQFRSALVHNGLRPVTGLASPPYTPQLNGYVEKAGGDVKRMASAMIAHLLDKDYIPQSERDKYRVYAFLHAVDIYNCVTLKRTGKSPYEFLYHRQQPLDEFRVFGAPAYVHLNKQQRTVPGIKTELGRYVGRQRINGSHIVYMSGTNRSRETIHVDFDELFETAKSSPAAPSASDEEEGLAYIELPELISRDAYCQNPEPTTASQSNEASTSSTSGGAPSASTPASSSGTSESLSTPATTGSHTSSPGKPVSHRTRSKVETSSISIYPRIPRDITVNTMNASHSVSRRDALHGEQSAEFRQAQRLEFNKFIEANAFAEYLDYDEVQSRSHLKDFELLRMNVIFANKFENGVYSKSKARMVVDGSKQQSSAGEDAYVMHADTQRTLSSIAASLGWKIRQADFESAFLQSPITNPNIYVRLPKEFCDIMNVKQKYARLGVAAYGIKEASKEWNAHLTKWFVKHGFKRFHTDPCLFSQHFDQLGMIYVGVSTDDLKCVAENEQVYSHVIQMMKADFKLKDLGILEWYLGIQYTQQNGLVAMDQSNFIDKLATKYGVHESEPVFTVLPKSLPTLHDSATTPTQVSQARKRPYRELLGSIGFVATHTRPDIAWGYSYLCTFPTTHGEKHWLALLHLLRYLYHSRHLKLTYRKQSSNSNSNILQVYTDSGFADDPMYERKSTGGFAATLNGAAITWKVKRLKTVLATAEVEYKFITIAGRHVCHARQQLKELGFEQLGPVTIHSDSQSAIAIANSRRVSQQSKHIDIIYHWIRDQIEDKRFTLKYINTSVQPADIFTKNLPQDALVKHRDFLMGIA